MLYYCLQNLFRAGKSFFLRYSFLLFVILCSQALLLFAKFFSFRAPCIFCDFRSILLFASLSLVCSAENFIRTSMFFFYKNVWWRRFSIRNVDHSYSQHFSLKNTSGNFPRPLVHISYEIHNIPHQLSYKKATNCILFLFGIACSLHFSHKVQILAISESTFFIRKCLQVPTS